MELADLTKIIEIVKRTAVDAVNAQKPVAICFGKVTKDDPLEILVDQKLVLHKLQLIFTSSVGSCSVGDELFLLRQQGGQKYVVVDKI